MKSHFFISSLALACLCMWTPDLFAAASSSPDSHAGAAPHGIFTASRCGAPIGPPAQGSEFDQRELSALNLLDIRYAEGQGVKRNPRIAMRFFPEEDHDATMMKLGMIAARLGSNNIGAAERLAGAIATRVVETCQCSPGQERELASNGPR